jgi:hypothetical protein
VSAFRLIVPPAQTVQLTEHWHVVKDGDPAGLRLYEQHYSAHQYRDGRIRKLFCGPGYKIVLLTKEGDALFVWRKFVDDSGQEGVNCAIFRNSTCGRLRSSDLILEAERVAWCRWPGERLYTYVDPRKITSRNPGYCFQCAGWSRCGVTAGNLFILEKVAA